MKKWNRFTLFFLSGGRGFVFVAVFGFFLFSFQFVSPEIAQAMHTASGAWVENPNITGCNHCHNVRLKFADNTTRLLTYSPSNSTYTGALRNDWSNTVNTMVGKGCPVASKASAVSYLNSCYHTTVSNPGVPEGPQPTCPTAAPDTTPPTIPGNVQAASDSSGTRVTLTWNPSTDDKGVGGYNIYRNYGTTPVGSTTGTTFTDTALTPSTAYTYEVEAYDTSGNRSSRSTPVQVTTAAPAGDTTPPSTPAGVIGVSDISGTKVFLHWNPSTDNVRVASYNVYRDGGTTPVGNSASPVFLDTGRAPLTTYSYEIEAVDAAGNLSSRSAPVTINTNSGSLLVNLTKVCDIPSPGVRSFVISPNFAVDGAIFVATGSNAVYKCAKSGTAWTRSNNLWPYSGFQYTGNQIYEVRMLAISPNFGSDQTLFAAAGGGIYKSMNGGTTWSIAGGVSSGFNFVSVAVSPNYATDNTVYAGTWCDGVVNTWGLSLYRSTNGGGTWSLAKGFYGNCGNPGTGLNGLGFTSVAVSPVSNQTVLAGVWDQEWLDHGVYRSTNGGSAWTRVLGAGATEPHILDIALSPNFASDCTAFAGGDTDNIWKSVDCGATWTPILAKDSVGMSMDAIEISPLYPANGNVLFCTSALDSGKYGLRRSRDGGTTWGNGAFKGAACTDVHFPPNYSAANPVGFAGDGIGIHQFEVPSFTDIDGDGWDAMADCNDNDPSIYPGATEIPNDGIDQDCNGSDLSFKLGSISTRAYVGTGANQTIGGFIIEGTAPKKVLIRGRGPFMSGAPYYLSGTLANPAFKLYSGPTVIAQNDNWQTADPLCLAPAQACNDPIPAGMDPCQPNPGQTVAPNGCTSEAAMVVTLPPGPYTAILSGQNGGVGLGIVEVILP